ncbi:MAG: hypothetical protein CMM07_05360 [Rhodopirellula sp.]|nr:hypothetical protein [Rhodopirellula sp.]
MKLIELNWSPTDRQLRQFGGVCMVMLPALGWIWGGSTLAILGLCILGLTLAAAALSHPTSIRPIFLTLMVITSPIGLVVGELSMIMIYFGLFLPLSLAFRVMGRDALQLKRLESSSSYWQEKKQPASASTYYRQS